jgi:hypothetical protein
VPIPGLFGSQRHASPLALLTGPRTICPFRQPPWKSAYGRQRAAQRLGKARRVRSSSWNWISATRPTRVSALTILESWLAVHDPPPALRGPRIGRPGKSPVRVQGTVLERVVLSTEQDPYLSLKALSGYSGLSRRTLGSFVNLAPDDALPCYRLDGKILVRRSDFDAWIVRHRSRGRPSLARAIRKLGLEGP